MSAPIATYSFLSWARQGLGIHLRNAAAGALRASVQVDVNIRGKKTDGSADASELVSRQVQLYGPGDVVGIDPRAIVRTEPRHWITNFEPNYLCFIEFADEDFLWRYTPAAPSPDQRRLVPWLTLAVLQEDEFEEGGAVPDRPLPFIRIFDAATKLPPAEQLWAWAHVHVGGAMGVDRNDLAALAQQLQAKLEADRDDAFCRLLSPRALKPNSGYHAFVIPTFETGRRAGLGQDPAGAGGATQVAWADPGAVEFPFYHRWYFRTGSAGDFEYLVRLLVPQAVDPRVGARDMDVQDPGSGLPGIDKLGGLLRLGGALRAPTPPAGTPERAEWDRWEEWAADGYPQPFQSALAAFVNLPDTYASDGTQDDPLIAPPIYGRWHAAVTRLDPTAPAPLGTNWLHELNLDPRFRAAAGFGTQVVQKNQEDYMEDAWSQVGKVLAANQRIRYAAMAMSASQVWHARHLATMQQATPERYLMLSAPVQRRVMAGGLTVYQQFVEGTVPPALQSKVARQVLRPGGRMARRVGLDEARNLHTLLGRVERGEVTAAPPKTVPVGLPTGDAVADALTPPLLPPDIVDAARRWPFLRWLPLLVALLLLLVLFAAGLVGILLGLVLVAAAVWLALRAQQAVVQQDAQATLKSGGLTLEVVDRLPTSPNFTYGPPGTTPVPVPGATDSEDARRFKDALRNLAVVDQAETALAAPVRRRLDLGALAAATQSELHPARTIPALTLAHVAIPPRIRAQMVEQFGEVMVYPELDVPMYAPLRDLSGELLVPNLQLIPVNSITLLETNQKFIEAYMVGLNHEFSRELLWREYPTDQRGSYFRQFWDVQGFLADAKTDPQALRERLRDIPELHRWSKSSALGDHDQREEQGDKEEEIVLAIRGELLKKYPTAVIYAHRARWERTADNKIDKSRPRQLVDLSDADQDNAPRDIVKTPLYEAKVDPDIYFFGFDLTVAKAKGGVVLPGEQEEDPGWFIVIKERPGEPRFGLDVARSAPATLNTWNDLAWSDVMTPYREGDFLRPGSTAPRLADPGTGTPAHAQYEEDRVFGWKADTHSAELAYILYQVPVLMAVHAAEMLPKE